MKEVGRNRCTLSSMEQVDLILWFVVGAGVLILLRQIADRAADYLVREGGVDESRELSRIAAFGLIAYSISQDLHHPDQGLWIYWVLICYWFYINSRAERL